MRDNEWRLVYAGTDLTFGPPDLSIVNMSAPDLGDADLRTDDNDRPRSDGRAFGQDFRGGRTITFDLGVFGASETEARDTLATLTRAWRGDAIRTTPNATATLRVRYAGRERWVYGRPRRFAADETEIAQGVAAVVADFSAADDLFYAAEENVENVSLVPGGGGGIATPLVTPLTTTATSDRSGVAVIGGNADASPVMEVAGPITNPTIEVVGLWSMTFETTLAYDETLVVDTRPWQRTAKVGNASRAGTLTRTSTRIGRATVPPGTYEVVLRGIDATGTSSLTFRTRDAFTTP